MFFKIYYVSIFCHQFYFSLLIYYYRNTLQAQHVSKIYCKVFLIVFQRDIPPDRLIEDRCLNQWLYTLLLEMCYMYNVHTWLYKAIIQLLESNCLPFSYYVAVCSMRLQISGLVESIHNWLSNKNSSSYNVYQTGITS